MLQQGYDCSYTLDLRIVLGLQEGSHSTDVKEGGKSTKQRVDAKPMLIYS
jgi:hypothetical protein